MAFDNNLLWNGGEDMKVRWVNRNRKFGTLAELQKIMKSGVAEMRDNQVSDPLLTVPDGGPFEWDDFAPPRSATMSQLSRQRGKVATTTLVQWPSELRLHLHRDFLFHGRFFRSRIRMADKREHRGHEIVVGICRYRRSIRKFARGCAPVVLC